MRCFIILYFTMLIGLQVFSQTTEKWILYLDKESQLMGYKDSEGQIMIEPRFSGLVFARKFENIIAVIEDADGQNETYYFTKSGKKIGIDSLHIYDNGTDCESEGFIRFRDKKTDKVGMFNKNGGVAIPAIYNELSRVRNGLIWALRGAEKKYWDEHNECNHYSWEGGQEMLLNTDNQILIEGFSYKGKLNFYSIEVQNQPSTNSTKVSFKGVNGQYYIFTDFEKEFTKWLKTELLPNLTLEKIAEYSMDSLTYWKKPDWRTEFKTDFLSRNFELLKERLLHARIKNTDYSVDIEGLNSFLFVDANYDQYYDNCGEPRVDQYPVMNVEIYYNERDTHLVLDDIRFLKTGQGYRLISIVIGNGRIK